MSLDIEFRTTMLKMVADGAAVNQPWVNWAWHAFEKGHYRLIPTRQKPDELYLARFWLTTPEENDGRYQSAGSTVLHYFARPDDDNALHDHPWPFKTSILNGGYTEWMPSKEWLGRFSDRTDFSGTPTTPADQPGPCLETEVIKLDRRPGQRVEKKATDLHMVKDVKPGTWTMVTMGERVRKWGFWPPQKVWMPWDEYLQELV